MAEIQEQTVLKSLGISLNPRTPAVAVFNLGCTGTGTLFQKQNYHNTCFFHLFLLNSELVHGMQVGDLQTSGHYI